MEELRRERRERSEPEPAPRGGKPIGPSDPRLVEEMKVRIIMRNRLG